MNELWIEANTFVVEKYEALEEIPGWLKSA